MMASVELIESYADLAIERWHRKDLLRPRGGYPRPHDPRFCCCLVCGDGRAVTGQRPLIPLFARRDLPEATS